jgi:biopolymer transport protein ExbB
MKTKQTIKQFSVSCFAALMLLAPATYAADIEADLLKRISAAQASLNKTEQGISRERAELARNIGQLERSVRELDKQTAAARRLEDERNLSLSALEERLAKWTNQRNYQSNLVQQFLRQQGNTEPGAFAAQLSAISSIASASERWLEPDFTPIELALPDGTVTNAQKLSLGPVHWALHDSQAFSIAETAAEWQVVKSSEASVADALEQLRAGKESPLAFDPSLSQFDQIPDESLLDHLQKGGIWALPILLFALIALVIGIIKAAQLLRLPAVVSYTPAALRNALQKNEPLFDRESMQQRLFETARTSGSARERDDQLFLQLQQNRLVLEKRLTAIAITASVAPLLGLLGTVSGMIETFRMMTLFGSGNPEVVSGGISQALITTELGLVVAIPALVVHSLLSRRARSYYLSLENFAVLLSQGESKDTPEKDITSRPQTTSSNEVAPA